MAKFIFYGNHQDKKHVYKLLKNHKNMVKCLNHFSEISFYKKTLIKLDCRAQSIVDRYFDNNGGKLYSISSTWAKQRPYISSEDGRYDIRDAMIIYHENLIHKVDFLLMNYDLWHVCNQPEKIRKTNFDEKVLDAMISLFVTIFGGLAVAIIVSTFRI